MSEWRDGRLDEVVEITMGQSPKGEDVNSMGIGMPLLNGPTEFGSNHPSPVQFSNYCKKIARKGSLLFCVRGSTTGKMNWADQDYGIGRGLASLTHKKGIELNHFLKGIIDYNLPSLLVSATGSTFPNVSKDQINGLKISIPPIPEQKAIAHILGTLDKKIELNRQMNQTLEAMAQALFKSWFVDFDPVLDNLPAEEAGALPDTLIAKYKRRKALPDDKKLIHTNPSLAAQFPSSFVFNETLGKWIPEGWEVKKLQELVYVKYGKDHKNLGDGTFPCYGSGGIMRYVEKAIFRNESVLIPRKGSLDNVMYVNTPFWSVDTMFYTEMKEEYFVKYFFYTVNKLKFSEMNEGSAVPSMTTAQLNSMDLLVPSTECLESFDKTISKYFSKKEGNENEIKTLTQLRDRLLPELISGRVRVNEN